MNHVGRRSPGTSKRIHSGSPLQRSGEKNEAAMLYLPLTGKVYTIRSWPTARLSAMRYFAIKMFALPIGSFGGTSVVRNGVEAS